ncbi:MAG: TolC family protein, partial [Betaproteobacteria bacterium]
MRVYSVGDQLIAYLAQAAHWVDQPASRLALGKLSPKVRAAVLAHPEARLASEQRETAALAKREAYAGFLPQVSANVETGNRNTDLVNTPWSYVPAHQDNSKAIAITGRQLLYDFGAVSNQVDARGALETAAAARSQVRRSELALRAMNAWLELFRGQQTLEVSRMNVLSRRQILSFVDEREQLGASAKSEVLRARARLADA